MQNKNSASNTLINMTYFSNSSKSIAYMILTWWQYISRRRVRESTRWKLCVGSARSASETACILPRRTVAPLGLVATAQEKINVYEHNNILNEKTIIKFKYVFIYFRLPHQFSSFKLRNFLKSLFLIEWGPE